MGIRKDTRVENCRMIHVWTDDKVDFHAEVRKDYDGWWTATTPHVTSSTRDYRSAVDTVMDEYRLTKAGFSSWEEAAAEMAEGPWEELTDAEQQDLINAARLMARRA